MSKIIYKPHCGECGFPIDTSENKVSYQEIYENHNEPTSLRRNKVGAIISPDRCAHCGALFDSIEITPPEQLPDMTLGE